MKPNILKICDVDDFLFEYKEQNGKRPAKWTQVTIFTKGTAPVSINGKHGVINRHGEVIISLDYDFIWSLKNGLMMVKLKDKFGFIDINNNVNIQIVYTDATHFSFGFAGVKLNNKWGIINKKEDIIINFIYDYGECIGRNLFCVGMLTDKIHDDHQKYTFPWTEFGEKLIVYGVINKVGDIIVPFKYYSKIKIINKREALIYNYEEQKFYIYDILDKLTKEYEEKLF